ALLQTICAQPPAFRARSLCGDGYPQEFFESCAPDRFRAQRKPRGPHFHERSVALSRLHFLSGRFRQQRQDDDLTSGEESRHAPPLHRLRPGRAWAGYSILHASLWFREKEETVKQARAIF